MGNVNVLVISRGEVKEIELFAKGGATAQITAMPQSQIAVHLDSQNGKKRVLKKSGDNLLIEVDGEPWLEVASLDGWAYSEQDGLTQTETGVVATQEALAATAASDFAAMFGPAASNAWIYVGVGLAAAAGGGSGGGTSGASSASGTGSTTGTRDTVSVLLSPKLELHADTGSRSNDGITSDSKVMVSGLEDGVTWQYSTNSGIDWVLGTGNSFSLASKKYDVGAIQVRQTRSNVTSSVGLLDLAVEVDDKAPTSTINGFDKYGSTEDGSTESSLTDIVGTRMTDVSMSSALLEGTTEAFAIVSLRIAGQDLTVSANASGYWSYRLTDTDFAKVGYGAETITVTGATDRAGNASSVQVTRDVTFNAVADTTSHEASGYGSEYVDALVRGGTGWKGTTITYSFAPGTTGSTEWTATEKQAFVNACRTYENVCNLHFVEGAYYADDFRATNIVLNKAPSSTWTNQPGYVTLADFNFPSDDYNYNHGALQGRFNYELSSWSNLTPGSLGFTTIIHELGHGLGLDHPFDGNTQFPGVSRNDSTDTGDYKLGQGVWTIMAYKFGWDGSPPSPDDASGYSKTPMTFDIAAMQAMYGANTSYKTGNDTYILPVTEVSGTGWECIWDAGGTDTISNAGSGTGCYINLNAYPKTGGVVSEGYVSYNYSSGTSTPSLNTAGGFTIADGVIIENAIGGNGADTLTGNGVSNTLTGNGGADKFVFNTALGASNVDTLTDFSVGIDQIQLDDAIFTSLLGSTTLASSRFRSGAGITAAADADDYLIYNTTTGAIFYDQDGVATAYAAVAFAILQTKPTNVTAAQFVVI